ncbi:hypothetical protein Sp245p_03580 [Azospirillum baldaniorum]|uniref:Tail fiber domain-containing protein n=1 Tax=Azospirillum baldaniorum TaxID=1064539 RepID=A0A9P1NNI8_9PROT|nr:hypothetical protein [Azospirillum baldaniorum]AWJ88935.1 hypothetical protein Sp245p_03580 [Azospirillum baldaniorum]TWA73352.1 hypothetical protein FBZ85_11644 [Azospirillum brasilense]CCC99351.1 protein of unknown function [Azospirillum baldaniorum]
MGLFDSQTTVSGSPDWATDYQKQNLNIAGQVAAQPYQQYGGDRVAQNPMLPGLLQWSQGMIGTAANTPGGYNTAAGVAGYRPETLAGKDLSAYMNPFTQNVVDASANEMRRQAAMTDQQIGGQAGQAGAYGGARHALLQAENTRNLNDQIGNMVAGLNLQNFSNAQNQAVGDISRGMQGQALNLQAAGQMDQSAAADQARLTSALGLSNQLGQQQQQYMQGLYDTNYQNWQDQQNYPLKQLQTRIGALNGNIPSQQTYFSNSAANAIGLGLGGAKLVSALGGIGGIKDGINSGIDAISGLLG